VFCCALFRGRAKGPNEIFIKKCVPLYGGKCLSCKAVHNWDDKRGKSFAHDEEVETEVQKWLRQQSEDFYSAGFDGLVKRWGTSVPL
jgi:hypothetical protein